MYSSKNKKDIKQILKYHRANDMMNLIKFFPNLSPIDHIILITSEDDYQDNIELIEGMSGIRNGNPISQPCMKSIPAKVENEDKLEILKKIKKENEDGVLILFHLNLIQSERYNRYAGISVAVSLGNSIYIEAVGKGFDGREVQKGICCHERYLIPWSDIRGLSIGNFKEYRTFIIDQKEYQKTRKERIKYLISCGINKKDIEKHIPNEYNEIPNFIWLDIITNLIKAVYREEEYLRSENYNEFQISGHTEGERFRPWQIANSNRIG